MTPTEAPSKPPRSAPLREKITWARKCPKTNGGEKISHERFAPMIGTSRRHLMRIERGQHRPGVELVKRIAEVTGHDLDYFADDDDEEADPAMRQAFSLFVDLLGQINSKAVNPKPAALPSDGTRDGLQTLGG